MGELAIKNSHQRPSNALSEDFTHSFKAIYFNSPLKVCNPFSAIYRAKNSMSI